MSAELAISGESGIATISREALSDEALAQADCVIADYLRAHPGMEIFTHITPSGDLVITWETRTMKEAVHA